MLSCPILSPSNLLVSPKYQPYPSKYLPKHVFLSSPIGGCPNFPFNTHYLVGMGGGGGGRKILPVVATVPNWEHAY